MPNWFTCIIKIVQVLNKLACLKGRYFKNHKTALPDGNFAVLSTPHILPETYSDLKNFG